MILSKYFCLFDSFIYSNECPLVLFFILQYFSCLLLNFFEFLSDWNLRMSIVVCHQVNKVKVQGLELLIGSYFKLSIIHFICLVEHGWFVYHFSFLIVLFYLLCAYLAGIIFMLFVADDTYISFAFGIIKQHLAHYLLLTL